MTSRRPPRPDIVVPALLGHVLLTALAWRDIARRDPSELRGGKNLWRLVTALNTGNHALYWLVGVRRR